MNITQKAEAVARILEIRAAVGALSRELNTILTDEHEHAARGAMLDGTQHAIGGLDGMARALERTRTTLSFTRNPQPDDEEPPTC